MVIEIELFSDKIIQIDVEDNVWFDEREGLYKKNVTSKTKKLKAKWTTEIQKDLSAYHSIDAEAELIKIIMDEFKKQ